MCGVFPGSAPAQAASGWVKLLLSDQGMWLLSVLARPVLARMAGVPDGFPRDAEQAAMVDWVIQAMASASPLA